MVVVNFIIQNILTQAAITIALIAMLGLLLQRKSFGAVLTGTFKTLLGFQVLSAGSAIIVTALTYFGKIIQHGFHLKGVVPSIEAINGQAMNTLGLGNEIALTFLGIFIVNIIIARVSPWKYIFLTGQALLWMSTMTVVGGKMAGLNAVMTIIVGSVIGGIFAVAMPAIAQPFVRKITKGDAIALGHFCTVGYMVEAGAAWLFGERGEKKHSIEDIKLPKYMEFLQDTYLSVAVVMVPLFMITAAFAGPKYAGNGTSLNYIMNAFMMGIQFVVGVYVLLAGVRL